MPDLTDIRTSLEAGFPEGTMPEALQRYRGRQTRAIGKVPEFPFEDAQFDVVLMDGAFVARASVKEAHRVLKPAGRLIFVVPERTKSQMGFTLPELYSMMRDGFDLVAVERPPWWTFGLRGRTLSICAQKKNWKSLTNTYRPYV